MSFLKGQGLYKRSLGAIEVLSRGESDQMTATLGNSLWWWWSVHTGERTNGGRRLHVRTVDTGQTDRQMRGQSIDLVEGRSREGGERWLMVWIWFIKKIITSLTRRARRRRSWKSDNMGFRMCWLGCYPNNYWALNLPCTLLTCCTRMVALITLQPPQSF
jgi:hypothetical protein